MGAAPQQPASVSLVGSVVRVSVETVRLVRALVAPVGLLAAVGVGGGRRRSAGGVGVEATTGVQTS